MLRVLMILSLAVFFAACKPADPGSSASGSVDEQAVPVHVTPNVAYEIGRAHV